MIAQDTSCAYSTQTPTPPNLRRAPAGPTCNGKVFTLHAFWHALLPCAAFFTGISCASLALGFALERALPGKRIWALPLDPGQLRHELIGNARFLVIAAVSAAAAIAGGWARLGQDSLLRGSCTFVALALGFQVYYYVLHRALHRRSLVRFHRFHHLSRVTTPLSGQSMSGVEALGWMLGYVGLPVAFSWLLPISFTGAAAYVGYNVFGNIVGHANVELVPRRRWLRWSSLLSNTFIFHALHHARWQGHYGFAAALMDRLCGSEWPDWAPLHARVVEGRPLTDLRERA